MQQAKINFPDTLIHISLLSFCECYKADCSALFLKFYFFNCFINEVGRYFFVLHT